MHPSKLERIQALRNSPGAERLPRRQFETKVTSPAGQPKLVERRRQEDTLAGNEHRIVKEWPLPI